MKIEMPSKCLWSEWGIIKMNNYNKYLMPNKIPAQLLAEVNQSSTIIILKIKSNWEASTNKAAPLKSKYPLKAKSNQIQTLLSKNTLW